MNNIETIEKNGEIEIDLQRVFGAIWRRIWIVIAAAVIGAAAAFAGTYFFITPLYQSAAMFYVNNNSLSVGDTSLSISSSDIVASKNLVDSYIVILKTRTSLNDVIDYAGVDLTYSELKDMISAAPVNSTEIFEVVVTSPDPAEAEKVANAIAYILPKRISSIIEGTSAKIVDSAVVAASPSSPNFTKNTMLGFLVGLVLSIGVIVLREIFDITVRTEEDITQVCKYPVLASVPDMVAPTKGGYYYADAVGQRKHGKKTKRTSRTKQPVMIGSEISFAATESYKLLRTKLQFSFADEQGCRVIGVSSAYAGEGKSLTSINLAHSLSQLDKKVLLIDCDMRRPSLSAKLPVKKQPGLSYYLSGQSKIDTLIQKCGIEKAEEAFDVISSGKNPPNPVELLSSARMTKLLAHLRTRYDYIILDFPPVGEVSDAMAVAPQMDGMLVVVRQNYCDRVALGAAVRQFEFVGAKILGVVHNCTTENEHRYGRGYYYKRYYRYGQRYEKAAAAGKAAAMEAGVARVDVAEEKEGDEADA